MRKKNIIKLHTFEELKKEIAEETEEQKQFWEYLLCGDRQKEEKCSPSH